jgi:hypothetical protein
VIDDTYFQNNPSAGQKSDLFGNPVCDQLEIHPPPSSDPAAVPEALEYCNKSSISAKNMGVAKKPFSTNLIGTAKDRLLHKPGVSLASEHTNIQNNPSASKTSDLLGRPVRDKLDRDSTTTTAAEIRQLISSTRTSDKFLSSGIGWASDDLRAHIGPPELNSPIVTRGA